MRIAYAIPVRHVDTLKDGTLLATGIESIGCNVPKVPAKIQASFVVALAALHVDVGLTHQLQVRILDPNMDDAVPPMHIGVGMNPGPNTPPGWEVRAQLPLIVRFEASNTGTYSVEMAVDGSTYGVPLIVQVPVPPPSP